jgi:hypothetical protein
VTQKFYLRFAASIFGLISILHVLRLLLAWQIVIGGYTFPMWLSWIGPFVAGFLSYEGFRLSRK